MEFPSLQCADALAGIHKKKKKKKHNGKNKKKINMEKLNISQAILIKIKMNIVSSKVPSKRSILVASNPYEKSNNWPLQTSPKVVSSLMLTRPHLIHQTNKQHQILLPIKTLNDASCSWIKTGNISKSPVLFSLKLRQTLQIKSGFFLGLRGKK